MKKIITSSFYDCLNPLSKFAFISLNDTLMPFKQESLSTTLLEYSETINEDQFWLDNIQWAWKCKEGLIKIPF